jgi:hypothetical protein
MNKSVDNHYDDGNDNNNDNDNDDDDDDGDEPYVKECCAISRKNGKKCISLSDCRYEIVKFAVQYLDWRECSRLDHIKVCCIFLQF